MSRALIAAWSIGWRVALLGVYAGAILGAAGLVGWVMAAAMGGAIP